MSVTIQSFTSGDVVEVCFMVPRAPRRARMPVWIGGRVISQHPAGYWVTVAQPGTTTAGRMAVTPERLRKPEDGDESADQARKSQFRRHVY